MHNRDTTKPALRLAREQAGKAARKQVPRSTHAAWKAPSRGRDPLALLRQADPGRIQALLPIRYGRMAQSPFAFLRGSAAVMACDLSTSPVSGIRVQACGDCHLLNFGAFATPERNIIFDINDFDETLPAPWEWDVKRLAASVAVAGRYCGFPERQSIEAVLSAVRTYREKIAEFAQWSPLQVWYAKIDAAEVVGIAGAVKPSRKGVTPAPRAAANSSAHLLPKLTEIVDGHRRIKDDPPLVYHPANDAQYGAHIKAAIRVYRTSLPPERRTLLDRYQIVDVAMKAVGVGSVGTRTAIALLQADADEPLFLQFKEARASVLEPYAGQSEFHNQGERVVVGQRMMQSASDLFLGWSRTGSPPFDFYLRQLRDMKAAINLDLLTAAGFIDYARYCGWALARAHARTGDPAMIGGYLGAGDPFDNAIKRFARAYADQTEKDHGVLLKAIRAGHVRADMARAG